MQRVEKTGWRMGAGVDSTDSHQTPTLQFSEMAAYWEFSMQVPDFRFLCF
jgi:hypothetical protein